MSTELKIKIKSLAAETKIIKHEESKLHGEARQSLQHHRKTVVRHEARHSLLAYGYMRGRPYRSIEMKCHEDPNWQKVQKMVERFGGGKCDNEIAAWREAS